VVAIHHLGTCQVPVADFIKSNRLALVKWGRVEGTVVVGRSPSADERVTIYSTRRGGVAPFPRAFTHFYKTRSDATGKFVIEKFPPGLGEAALPAYIPARSPAFGFFRTIPENSIVQFHVKSGETTSISIGGEGLQSKAVSRKAAVKQDVQGAAEPDETSASSKTPADHSDGPVRGTSGGRLFDEDKKNILWGEAVDERAWAFAHGRTPNEQHDSASATGCVTRYGSKMTPKKEFSFHAPLR